MAKTSRGRKAQAVAKAKATAAAKADDSAAAEAAVAEKAPATPPAPPKAGKQKASTGKGKRRKAKSSAAVEEEGDGVAAAAAATPVAAAASPAVEASNGKAKGKGKGKGAKGKAKKGKKPAAVAAQPEKEEDSADDAAAATATATAAVDASDAAKLDDEGLEEAVAAGIVAAPATATRTGIYNAEGLQRALDVIAQDGLSFTERPAITVPDRVALENPDDDLTRETLFYNQALAAVKAARKELESAAVPHFRPPDYFAEMMKSDMHMEKVKAKLLFEQRKIAAFEQRKREQESRKFAKELQAERTKQKAAEKRDQLNAVKAYRKRKDNSGAPLDDKGLDMMLAATRPTAKKGAGAGAGAGAGGDRRGGPDGGKRNWKRDMKNQKFGFSGPGHTRGGVGGPSRKRVKDTSVGMRGAGAGGRPGKKRRENLRQKRKG